MTQSNDRPFAVRPRRSVLYVPASNARAIEKARALPCDAVVLDLEDAVAPEKKASARESVSTVLRDGGFGHRDVIVRVNALDTEWGAADLAAISQTTAHAVLVPKVRNRADVLAYEKALAHAPSTLQLWSMIETAIGLLKLDEIASCARDTRLACFVLGTNDLAKEMRMQMDHRREPLTAFLSLTVAAARAYELTVLDGVYNAFEDAAGFEAQCQQGLAYGFDGKTLIHPRQIDICNAVFSPSPATVTWAEKIRAAFALPENAAKGAINLEGAMVERLHLTQAERVLALDAAIRSSAFDKLNQSGG
jgi:citrate lyase subunit beta/citryl-CoA lyase